MHCLDLAAKEEERVWVKRQTDGELDDSRLTEGLTGDATVYKRRGMEKPELGRPQIKYAVPILNVILADCLPDPRESGSYLTSALLCP